MLVIPPLQSDPVDLPTSDSASQLAPSSVPTPNFTLDSKVPPGPVPFDLMGSEVHDATTTQFGSYRKIHCQASLDSRHRLMNCLSELGLGLPAPYSSPPHNLVLLMWYFSFMFGISVLVGKAVQQPCSISELTTNRLDLLYLRNQHLNSYEFDIKRAFSTDFSAAIIMNQSFSKYDFALPIERQSPFFYQNATAAFANSSRHTCAFTSFFIPFMHNKMVQLVTPTLMACLLVHLKNILDMIDINPWPPPQSLNLLRSALLPCVNSDENLERLKISAIPTSWICDRSSNIHSVLDAQHLIVQSDSDLEADSKSGPHVFKGHMYCLTVKGAGFIGANDYVASGSGCRRILSKSGDITKLNNSHLIRFTIHIYYGKFIPIAYIYIKHSLIYLAERESLDLEDIKGDRLTHRLPVY
ncbi:hypothetical protein L1987_47960 [Smallanthus sonchifolius]|uniref:Uncharacterized protein n=1 Tax=Smallanthus sonchifolius TaxID=185202 RepID=A0ACB9FRI1_9ASTR|nr:hypothetical protein L1987_47960 [Smallanthus sonchifolius]